ncbi:hypothetical protein [uncultured Jannaschia sp.]|uniref:hypothetical protein n=1 Tax=uncultured Jannaschia sp. TaxID=293347 RepID=UPI00260FF2D1|nr:hypothetical protein [uncultured Jannaschia sp.]
MGKLIPIAVILVALLGGGAAGYLLKPPPVEDEHAEEVDPMAKPEKDALAEPSAVTLRDAFVVPVLRDGRVWSNVIVTLGVRSEQTPEEKVLSREPVLRDGLNQALFLHGSLGGFDGDFTEPRAMERLRKRLDEVVMRHLSDETARVLIVSLARQSA